MHAWIPHTPRIRHPPGTWHPPSPQQTATVADGTHPTGMHSCYIISSTEGCTIWCEISQDIPEDTELVATFVRDVDQSLRSSPSSSITSQTMITTQRSHSRSAASSPTASSTEANRGKTKKRLHCDRCQIGLFPATRVEHNATILFFFHFH